jgi:hypothetical protein
VRTGENHIREEAEVRLEMMDDVSSESVCAISFDSVAEFSVAYHPGKKRSTVDSF